MKETYFLLVTACTVRVLDPEEIPEIREQIDNRGLLADIVKVTAEPGWYVYNLDRDELWTLEQEAEMCDRVIQEYAKDINVLTDFILETEASIENLVKGALEKEYNDFCLDWANEDGAFDDCVEVRLK